MVKGLLGAALQSIDDPAAAVGHQPTTLGCRVPLLTRLPTVKLTMQGIRRTHVPQQVVRKMRGPPSSIIYWLVDPLGTSLIDQRDRALLLLGFAGAFRLRAI
ncbi:hypothetical protein [Ktedonobacter robiniae]|uniref:Uncharacterized protein n=1 Tax=Ktedonobacter robiniae TaxID=2778365 RepID=A0ABQ3UM32_9CHLR|nr:hypothetical protein [Ktedonobacter robiniae]GHO53743.1 hypothetical protein KSB_22180 [Ktedonobacter robiniae]